MANRDMTMNQYSFEKARKTLDAHLAFGAAGAVTLDGPGSKGALSITKVATPAGLVLYTINLGVSVNGLNFVDTYVKTLVLDNVPEIEYSGNTNPAATATMAVFRDDVSNNTPQFGDLAPSGVGQVAAGGGAFVAGAYKWIVTAVDANGNETQISTAVVNEVSNGAVTLNQQVTISWTALGGAATYNVYRTLPSGASGTETVFVGNTAGVSLIDPGTAGNALYQGGNIGFPSKLPNSKLPAFNFSRPPFGYGSVTVQFLNGTTPTAPAQGEGMRIQVELGDSGAA